MPDRTSTPRSTDTAAPSTDPVADAGAHMVLRVGLVVGRTDPVSPWADVSWRGVAVLPAPSAAGPWTPLGREGLTDRFYAGEATIVLHRTETANYRDNLASGDPRLWVVLRWDGREPPVEIVAVTADPAEGEAFTETGTENVETVPMAAEIASAVADFVDRHHVERRFEKRRRVDADPEALALRPRLAAAPGCGPDGE